MSSTPLQRTPDHNPRTHHHRRERQSSTTPPSSDRAICSVPVPAPVPARAAGGTWSHSRRKRLRWGRAALVLYHRLLCEEDQRESRRRDLDRAYIREDRRAGGRGGRGRGGGGAALDGLDIKAALECAIRLVAAAERLTGPSQIAFLGDGRC